MAAGAAWWTGVPRAGSGAGPPVELSTPSPPHVVADAPVSATAPDAPPSPAIELAPERRARITWDAKARSVDGNAVPGGTRCLIEATVSSVGGGEPRLLGIAVRCGKRGLYAPDGLPAGATASVRELPGLIPGTYSYRLEYRDDRSNIDTPHGGALVGPDDAPSATARFVVATESRPVKEKLAASTPTAFDLQAHWYPMPPWNDEATGRVLSASGDVLVDPGQPCRIGMHHYGTRDGVDRCDVIVMCGVTTLIGAPKMFASNCERRGSRIVRAEDPESQSEDGDPALVLDERQARVWNDGTGSRWSVKIALEPRPTR